MDYTNTSPYVWTRVSTTEWFGPFGISRTSPPYRHDMVRAG